MDCPHCNHAFFLWLIDNNHVVLPHHVIVPCCVMSGESTTRHSTPRKMASTFKMKNYHVLLLILTLTTSTSALWGLSFPITLRQQPLGLEQQPLMNIFPGMAKPQSTTPSSDIGTPRYSQADSPIVSDVLPKTKGINIFARLTRDFEVTASRLNDASKNITVLAPHNKAIQALPRKPWENPEDYDKFGGVNAYQGPDGQERAKRNLQRFVEAHLVPASPWRSGEEVETLGGVKLKWVKEGDKIMVCFFLVSGSLGEVLIDFSRSNLGILRLVLWLNRCRMGRFGF